MATRKIDLNLFRVFSTVMQHRSVASAAQELGVTASAVSHALARLRYALKDELFVYGDSGMVPTRRALELAPNISKGLGLIASAVNSRTFNPAETIRTFRIASSDYTGATLFPYLVGRLAKFVPLIDFRFLPLGRTDIIRQLDEGYVDMVVGWFGDLRIECGEQRSRWTARRSSFARGIL